MFDIRQESDGQLRLAGRLDAAQAEKADAVLSRVSGSIVCDLEGLEYISSAGLGVFVKAQLRLQSMGHTIRLINVQPRVRPIFHFALLAKTFGIE